MTKPILVWGTKGLGCSMLIWIIKKLRDPKYFIDDPIDPETFSAHRQPRTVHWFGDVPLPEFIQNSGVPEIEQIYHCEPNFKTFNHYNKSPQDYKSIVIYAASVIELQQIAVLQKYKDPPLDYSIQDLFQFLCIDDVYIKKGLPHSLNISFSEFFTDDITELLHTLTSFLEIDPTTCNFDAIKTIHYKWYCGSKQLLVGQLDKFL